MGWGVAQRAELVSEREVAAARVLAVTRLSLSRFRNYGSLRLDLAPSTVVFTGPNGAGKTNLLEAVSLLAPGRGLRRARLADLGNREQPGAPAAATWAIAASLQGPLGPVDIGTGIEARALRSGEDALAAPPPMRRAVRIDGRTVSGPATLAEVLAVRWLTPAMDRMFTDSASRRRRFLDHLVSGLEPAHASRVSAYERTVRQRASLLKEPAWDVAWVSALEETLVGLGTAISAQRRDYITRLCAVMDEPGAPAAGAQLRVQGDVEGWLESMPSIEAEERYRSALTAARSRDGIVGGAGAGPHRSDLCVLHSNGNPADQCSTGEQKALLFAMVEADARLVSVAGRVPILLLDEVTAHLDDKRRSQIFSAAHEIGAQVWATGTDRSLFSVLDGAAQFFTVDCGEVIQE